VSKRSLIGTLSLALIASTAWAQDKPASSTPPTPSTPPAAAPEAPKQKWVVACEGDIKKHCLEAAKAGDPRECLAQHEPDLTQACKDTFIRQYKILLLCKGDIDKLCGGSPDPRELAKCFNEKQSELSPKCKSALTRGSREHEKAEAKAEAAAKTEAAPAPAARKKKAAAKKETAK
jgi:hypothetical protein